MTRYTTLLEEMLEAWAYTRAGVIAEARNLPASGWDVRPASGARTPGQIVWHIIESGLLMAGELSRPDGDFTRKPYPRLIREYTRTIRRRASRSDLLRLLDTTHEQGARQIRRAGELHMLQLITRFDGQPGTRLAWMHHGVSHEEYHRGQLALEARLSGRVPALTKRILGA
ncbi:MAG TPA: DinB family protein [Vicinamibacterales bacterium]|nr:DinB family protein [Vicinamibacterales bacterium]